MTLRLKSSDLAAREIPNSRRWRKFVLCYCSAAILLFLAIESSKHSVADVYSALAQAHLEYWRSHNEQEPSRREIAQLQRMLQQAIILDVENPEHHDRLSQLFLWKMIIGRHSPKQSLRIVDAGLNEARFAVAKRPGWPLSWARLLVWKANFDSLDTEFQIALERVTHLGPWEIGLHNLILKSTLPVWNKLQPENRKQVLQTAVRGLMQTPDQTISILRLFGKLPEVCKLIKPEGSLFNVYCQNLPIN
jgi:hypothetical protein